MQQKHLQYNICKSKMELENKLKTIQGNKKTWMKCLEINPQSVK